MSLGFFDFVIIYFTLYFYLLTKLHYSIIIFFMLPFLIRLLRPGSHRQNILQQIAENGKNLKSIKVSHRGIGLEIKNPEKVTVKDLHGKSLVFIVFEKNNLSSEKEYWKLISKNQKRDDVGYGQETTKEQRSFNILIVNVNMIKNICI